MIHDVEGVSTALEDDSISRIMKYVEKRKKKIKNIKNKTKIKIEKMKIKNNSLNQYEDAKYEWSNWRVRPPDICEYQMKPNKLSEKYVDKHYKLTGDERFLVQNGLKDREVDNKCEVRFRNYCYKVLVSAGVTHKSVSGDKDGYVQEHIRVETLNSAGKIEEALAYSTLYSLYPVQVSGDENVIVKIVNIILPEMKILGTRMDLVRRHPLDFFRFKKDPLAKIKANVYLSELLSSLKRVNRHLYDLFLDATVGMYNMTNDMACCVLLHGCGMSDYFDNPFIVSVRLMQNMKSCKFLTNVLKGHGLQICNLGAMLCECDRMYGKSFLDFDLGTAVSERVGIRGQQVAIEDLDMDRLGQCIKLIVDSELSGREVKFEHPDIFWGKRIMWCKNGGHSKALERANSRYQVNTRLNLYRKVAMEYWEQNPIYTWDGKSFVSASEKNENGKRRMLLACDTATYVCFEHLLRPVENAWRNKSVLLNPDLRGRVGIVERLIKEHQPYNVALDYDDFNSQHSLAAQALVIQIVGEKSNYPSEYLRRLVNSLYNMEVSLNGETYGMITGGLASGHRITSFVNSILNKAYMLYVNDRIFEKNFSLHTGDDTIAKLKNINDVYELLGDLSRNKFRLNNSKQSVGLHTSEFLRMCVGRKHAFGYYARSVASVVNGNWENTEQLPPSEFFQSIVSSIFSLIFRSGQSWIGNLFVDTLNRKTKISKKYLKNVVEGRIAVNNGPLYTMSSTGMSLEFKYKNVIDSLAEFTFIKEKIKNEKSFGTQEYVSNHLTPAELYGGLVTGLDIASALKSSSYMKSLRPALSSVGKSSKIIIGSVKKWKVRDCVSVRDFLRTPKTFGVLESLPVLQLVKDRLTRQDLIICCKLMGVAPDLRNLYKFCFGEENKGCIIRGVIPYSDAAMMGKYVGGSIVMVQYNIYY
jgi:hypothetical protein